jgi:hypothetical protein
MTVHTTRFNQGMRPLGSPSTSPTIKGAAPRLLRESRVIVSSVFGILARAPSKSPKPRRLTGPMAFYEISEGAHGSCAICRDEFTGLDLVMKVNQCDHIMHDRCSEEWFGSKSACICQDPSHLSSTAFGSSTPGSNRESPKPKVYPRERMFPLRKSIEDTVPPEPSPSPVSSPFTETTEYQLDASPLRLSVESNLGGFGMQPSLSQEDSEGILQSLNSIQKQLFQMQRQLNMALANVQDITQKIQRGRQVTTASDLRRSVDDFVITSFDGKPVRFDS